jgi:hypothetical protein
MTFSIGLLYKKLSHKYEFHGNRCSDRHTFLKGVNEIFPAFSTLFVWFEKKSVELEIVHKF